MILDEGFDGNVFYGPSLSLYREPFVNERYLLGDGRYHNCGPYLDMEKKFFRENEAVVREVFFDTNNLLGVDSEEDLDVEVSVNYHDLVPEILSEESQLRRAAVREILETKLCGCLRSIWRVKTEKLWSGWRPLWSWRLTVTWWMPVWLLVLLTLA